LVNTIAALTTEFDITYSTDVVVAENWTAHPIDKLLGTAHTPINTCVITHEKLKLHFGESLKTLWSRSRSVMAATPYQKHLVDVPRLYEKDVYMVDPTTGYRFSFNAQGEIQYTLLHSVGDPVLDDQGQPTFKHRVGDPVLDANANPVPISEALVVRQIDLLFIEGAYYFATDSAASKYRQDMIATMVEWLTVDLKSIGSTLLEQSRIYFYPKTSMGKVKAIVEDGTIVTLDAGQRFTVRLYVTKDVLENTKLRESLTVATIKTVDQMLKPSTISSSDIISTLKQTYSTDVISFHFEGLGGAANYAAITMVNEHDRCSIRKKLVNQPDNKLIVKEDVTVEFIKHKIA
jgi:hypothetical protein